MMQATDEMLTNLCGQICGLTLKSKYTKGKQIFSVYQTVTKVLVVIELYFILKNFYTEAHECCVSNSQHFKMRSLKTLYHD